MNKTKISTKAIILGGITLLVSSLIFLPIPEESHSNIGIFLGRFHPLILHFPIVLVLLLTFYEIRNFYLQLIRKSFSKIPDSWTHFILLLTAISSNFTVVIGFLLYQSGDYQGELVRRHLWGGLLLVIALNGAVFFYWKFQQKTIQANYLPYQSLLLIAGILTIYTSHIGGSITHGQDFLTEHLPEFRTTRMEEKPREALLLYEDIIQPIMESRCWSCHNEYKTKGGLLMTSFTDLQKGGKSEKPMLVANQPSLSELYHRITLADTDDEHMPPIEKPQLSEGEIALIHWWIAEGAKLEIAVGNEPPDSIAAILEEQLPDLQQYQLEKLKNQEEKDVLAKKLDKLGEKLGLVIKPDPTTDKAYFTIAMQMPAQFVNDKTLKRLLPYAPLFSKISLPSSEITDDGLYNLGKMKNLQELYLQQTCVNGGGLIYLKSLEQLQILNLSHTFLTDEGLLNILQLSKLEKLYLFNTEVNPIVYSALDQNQSQLQVLIEEGPTF